MNIEIEAFFKRYEALVEKVEAAFSRMKASYPNEIACKQGCSDCCHALFDLTLIEAMYLNNRFNRVYGDGKGAQIMDKADTADRRIHKIKRAAFKASQAGKDDETILREIALERIECPLLNQEQMCSLYDFRPIACRSYGIPTAFGGKGHTCGISGFKEGERYPTLNQDIIHDQLLALSEELIVFLKSKNSRMGDMLVPVSMALLTEYDAKYLGLPEASDEQAVCKEEK